MCRQPFVLGFDLEWYAPMKVGVSQGLTALVQLCSAEACFLLHIKHAGVPAALRELLEDESILKAGVGTELSDPF